MLDPLADPNLRSEPANASLIRTLSAIYTW